MNNFNKSSKYNKFGFSSSKKKIGVNYWRFILTGVDSRNAQEQQFFIELEFINPWLSQNVPLLGFKPRVKISEEDLQYVLAGTESAKKLETESIIQPSYCSVRITKFGDDPKQLVAYFPIKDIIFSQKPFQITIGNMNFSEEVLSGFLNLSSEEVSAHPEYLCSSGYASWNLNYKIIDTSEEGFSNNAMKWFPYGLKANFSGKVNFDGVDYLVDPKKCNGYSDRFYGKAFPESWYHISTNKITSNISGQILLNSSVSIQGIFEDKISFIGNFEGSPIVFTADSSSRSYSCVWDCNQSPDSNEENEEKLHWSCSIHNKFWVVDVDVYCKVRDLVNRKLELPEGKRKVLNLVNGTTGFGEIKLYKKDKNILEQIEYAKLENVTCEFGQNEDSSD